MRALDIIEAEHRNMWRVTNALGVLGKRLEAKPEAGDLHTVELIVQYLDEFSERFHHPKESDLLFARIRRRSNAAAEIIERLERDHEMSPDQVARIRDLARTTHISDRAGLADLRDEIASFRLRLDEHMHIEEEVTFPLAREALTADDWAEIDAGFAAHVDPLGAANDDDQVALLRARITQLLPAPEGLGGRSEMVTMHLPRHAADEAGTLLEIVAWSAATAASRRCTASRSRLRPARS